ncbi:MAG: glycosyltransferase family 2 protein [Actinobacteria bacterium]|nr:glycosyltransferase family 2 protein [Actinomycetota bacterium]
MTTQNTETRAQNEAVTTIHPSSFVQFIDQLLTGDRVDPDLAESLLAVRTALTRRDDETAPFLTVLLRTQGRRIEPLKDALLCLAAQTDQDFEVVVIDHNADDEGARQVRQAIAEQPAAFAERIRVVEVSEGSRSKPLNAGIRVARGHYIAVYDDDDLLFGNWVEEFRRASERADGRMLRAVAATQKVEPEAWPTGETGFRTSSWPTAEYATTFDMFDHFRVNHSPFMTWAFPHVLFTKLGFEFDEALSVCEDWDVILRGSAICGVEDVDSLTSIYRRWQGGQSSYSVHDFESWRASEKRVIDRLDDSVLLFPAGTVTRIRELLEVYEEGNSAREQLHHVINSLAWKLSRPIRGLVRVGRFGKRAVRKVVREVTARRPRG